MDTFAADIERWVAKTKLSADVVLRKIGLDALTGVMGRSPVDTGRFRASNRLSVNKVDTFVAAPRKRGAVGGSSVTVREVAAAEGAVVGARFGDTIHITNSLPYAKPLEDGSSKQNGNAPDGIYGATFLELGANLDKAIRQAAKS